MRRIGCVLTGLLVWFFLAGQVYADDLKQVQERGVLRHLGVPYANFVTGSGDGLDVEVMRLFAKSLGVSYEYVETTWAGVIADLTGKRVKAAGTEIEVLGEAPIKGDVIANGFTKLAWREKALDYSDPMFPSQIWVVTRPEFPMDPIVPTGDLDKDIAMVRALLKGRSVLGVANTCLDPKQFRFDEAGAEVKLFEGSLNEVAPAVMNKEADISILDVPDALVAIEKWPGQMKIIGPISKHQVMGCGFRKNAPELREAFNAFLAGIKKDGTFLSLVKKYYPAVFEYYPDFFNDAVQK